MKIDQTQKLLNSIPAFKNDELKTFWQKSPVCLRYFKKI